MVYGAGFVECCLNGRMDEWMISFKDNCVGERWKVQNPGTKPLMRSLRSLKWVGTAELQSCPPAPPSRYRALLSYFSDKNYSYIKKNL